MTRKASIIARHIADQDIAYSNVTKESKRIVKKLDLKPLSRKESKEWSDIQKAANERRSNLLNENQGFIQ